MKSDDSDDGKKTAPTSQASQSINNDKPYVSRSSKKYKKVEVDSSTADETRPYRDFASETIATSQQLQRLDPTNSSFIVEINQLTAAARAAGESSRADSEGAVATLPASSPRPVVAISRSFSFPTVLHIILEYSEEQSYDVIISWQYHGRAFQVHDPDRFVLDVMPHFFQQTRYPSFLRQLALYDFQRIKQKDHPDYGCYYHEMFLRGMPHLCQSIPRARAKGSFKRHQTTDPNFSEMKIVGLKSKKREAQKQQIAPPLVSVSANQGFPVPMQMQNLRRQSAAITDGDVASAFNHLTSQVDSQTLCLPVARDPQASNLAVGYSNTGQPSMVTLNVETSQMSQVGDRNHLYGLLALAMNQIQHQQSQSQSLVTFASNLMGNSQDHNRRSLQVGNEVQVLNVQSGIPRDVATSRLQLSSNTGSDNVTLPALSFPTEDAQEQDTDIVGFLSDVGLVGMGGNETFELAAGTLPQRAVVTAQNMSVASTVPEMPMPIPGVASLPHNNGSLQQQYASFIQQMVNYQQQIQQQVQQVPLYQSSSVSIPTIVPYQNNMQLTQLPWSQNPELPLQLQQQQSLLLSHQSFLDEARLSHNPQPQHQYADAIDDTTTLQQQLPGQGQNDDSQDGV